MLLKMIVYKLLTCRRTEYPVGVHDYYYFVFIIGILIETPFFVLI